MKLTEQEMKMIEEKHNALLSQTVNLDLEFKLLHQRHEVLKNLFDSSEEWLDKIEEITVRMDEVFDFAEAYQFGKTTQETDLHEAESEFRKMIVEKNGYWDLYDQRQTVEKSISFEESDTYYGDRLIAMTNTSYYVQHLERRSCFHQKYYIDFIRLGMEQKEHVFSETNAK